MTNPPDEVLTPHLRLRALSLEYLTLLRQGDRHALAARIEARVPDEWPGPALASSLPVIAARTAQNPADTAGWVWVVIERSTAAVVGDIGFHSPVRGVAAVEIGYVILPAARGRGYATEAAGALIAWAFAQPGVERVSAQIKPDNTASLRVAQKLGMRETAPDEPGYRRFERRKSDPPAWRAGRPPDAPTDRVSVGGRPPDAPTDRVSVGGRPPDAPTQSLPSRPSRWLRVLRNSRDPLPTPRPRPARSPRG